MWNVYYIYIDSIIVPRQANDVRMQEYISFP